VPFADPASDPELPVADRTQSPVASSSADSRRPPPVARAGYEAADEGSRQAVMPAQAMAPVAGSPPAGASDHPSGDHQNGNHPSGGNRAASSPFRPRDPFDPEIFNRRYLPDARR
jgi:hypothetical protein